VHGNARPKRLYRIKKDQITRCFFAMHPKPVRKLIPLALVFSVDPQQRVKYLIVRIAENHRGCGLQCTLPGISPANRLVHSERRSRTRAKHVNQRFSKKVIGLGTDSYGLCGQRRKFRLPRCHVWAGGYAAKIPARDLP